MSIIDNANARIYEIDGCKYPSVTTILGILQKPALVPWAAKTTAEAFKTLMTTEGGIDQLKGIVYCSWDQLDEFVDRAKKAHREKSKAAMSHGTLVHEAIAFWIEQGGRPNCDEVASFLFSHTIDPVAVAAAMKGFNAFLAWGNSNDLHIISSEQVVSDYAFYAGRYDLVAQLNGKVVLIDIKTSTGIYDEYWLQCAAYANAGFDELPDAIGVLRIDKETGDIEYQERMDYHHEIEAFNMLAIAYDHLQKCKPKGEKRGNNNK